MRSDPLGMGEGAHAYLCFPVRAKSGERDLFLFGFYTAPPVARGKKSSLVKGDVCRRAELLSAFLKAVLAGTPLAGEAKGRPSPAQDFLSFAAELKPSLRLAEFAGRFARRAAEIVGAPMALLGLTRGALLETVYIYDSGGTPEPAHRSSFDRALAKLVAQPSDAILSGQARAFLGPATARSLGWRNLCLVRLAGRDGELLGALCLVNSARDLTASEQNLLSALADHASVALENSRLFSRIEQSKRQWVEDFDAIQDLIVVHDPANHILRVNRSLAEVLGVRPSDLIGRDVKSLRSIAGTPKHGACPFCSESLTLGAAEESILVAGARAFLISTSRIGGNSEEGSRTIHILKDITEQRSYQIQLQRERDFNTKILNHTQNMILVLDTAGLVSYANRRCYEAGYRKEDLLGKSLAEFLPREHRPWLEKAFQAALRGSATENLEFPVWRGNRSTGRYQVSLSPIRDEEGHVNSVVVVMTDITDAAVLQSQLRHSEKMAALGQLVSGVAHEINNPLAAIVGYADLLSENGALAESAREELRIVLQEAERARQNVQNLLRFARQMPPRRERVDIGSILRHTLQLRSYGSAGDGVEVVERLASRISPIFGDVHQLQQVFLNILNNAYDAVREAGRAGRIEVSACETGGFVEISIRDNGTGILDADRIFEPFYTTKEVGKGTGLGLSICYGIVQEHGGEILCGNNAEGAGCTFRVRLPADRAAKKASFAEVG